MNNNTLIPKTEMSIKDEIKLMKASENTVFMVDYSGSMLSIVENVPKYSHVASMLATVCATNMIAFSSGAKRCNSISDYSRLATDEAGGTNLSNAFEHLIKSSDLHPGLKKIIIISDGETSYAEECYKLAKQIYTTFGCTIDSILIGNSSMGKKILDNITKIGHGQSVSLEEKEGLGKVLLLTTQTLLLK